VIGQLFAFRSSAISSQVLLTVFSLDTSFWLLKIPAFGAGLFPLRRLFFLSLPHLSCLPLVSILQHRGYRFLTLFFVHCPHDLFFVFETPLLLFDRRPMSDPCDPVPFCLFAVALFTFPYCPVPVDRHSPKLFPSIQSLFDTFYRDSSIYKGLPRTYGFLRTSQPLSLKTVFHVGVWQVFCFLSCAGGLGFGVGGVGGIYLNGSRFPAISPTDLVRCYYVLVFTLFL